METHLRLADRRGVLQGAALSPIQARAVEILMALDLRERASMLHLQQAAAGIVPQDDEDIEDGEAAEGSIEWVPPTEETVSMIEEWMAEHSQGQISGRELVGGGDWL